MTSFIVSRKGQELQRKHKELARVGIQVGWYETPNDGSPSPDSFEHFLAQFTRFCQNNKDKKCDSLVFTGSHGDYNPPLLNNLNQAQLQEIVKIAKQNNVSFQHIVADCCCSTYGLDQMKGLLADGGLMIGDRVTSTAYWVADAIFDGLAKENVNGNMLMHEATRWALGNFNAPHMISRQGETYITYGTTDDEITEHWRDKYTELFGYRPSYQQIRRMLPQDTALLESDLANSQAFFKFQNYNSRTELFEMFDKNIEQSLHISKLRMIEELKSYKNLREEKSSENYLNILGFLSRPFGAWSKQEKFAAVDALIEVLEGKTDKLDPQYIGPLKQGNLGKLIKDLELDLSRLQEVNNSNLHFAP